MPTPASAAFRILLPLKVSFLTLRPRSPVAQSEHSSSPLAEGAAASPYHIRYPKGKERQ